MSIGPEAAGRYHSDLIRMSSDTAHGLNYLPGVMREMLEQDAWRELVRPVDGKVFRHATVREWILGPAWAGLQFKSWDLLYAILKRSEDGREAMRLLVEHGAPVCGLAEDAEPLAEHGAIGNGRGRGSDRTSTSRGETAAYLVRKLKRDAPDIAEALARGEFKSARAAAKAAGLVRDKTPLEQLEHWWSRASAQERAAFFDRVNAGGL